MKKLMILSGALAALAACATAQGAATYWLKAASSGNPPPKCFTFYSDEACTTKVTVTPTANDGNTYVVLGSAKMTGSYTAPAGTTWFFGSKSKYVSFYTNGGISMNFDGGSECTIYGIEVNANSPGTLTWKGTNRFVNVGKSFSFSPVNSEATKPRGVDLAGTFFADTDVTVRLSRNQAEAGSIANWILSGDFSAYKGKFVVSNTHAGRVGSLQLTSETAFGDASVEAADMFTLTGNVTWRIDPAVRQYATKGITLSLSAGQTNKVTAAANTSWTLTAPLVGTAGTFAKVGEGTVELAGSVSMPNIVVEEGTLVVDAEASFAEGTAITVRPGAQLVSRVGLNIPNVTVTTEEGGGFSFDFTTPYADGATTALDYSTLTAEDWAALAKPVPLKLATAIPLPLNATNRLALVKFPEALHVTAADFKNATTTTYNLPTTWFEVTSDGAGCDVVYLVARPAVYLTVTRDDLNFSPVIMNAVQTSEKDQQEYVTWSDGLVPHAGADYVIANGTTAATCDGWKGLNSVYTFPGESLTLANGSALTYKSATNRFARLVSYGGTTHWVQGMANKAYTRQVLEGNLELVSGNVYFKGDNSTIHKTQFDIAATVTGEGAMTFTGNSGGLAARFSGDGTAFAGTVVNEMEGGSVGNWAAVEIPDFTRVVADRAIQEPRALLGNSGSCAFHATEDCLFTGVNYGIAFSGYNDALSVAEGKTLTLNTYTRFQSTVAYKTGAGTLALGGEITYGYDGNWNSLAYGTQYELRLQNGWLKPYVWNNGKSYRYLCVKIMGDAATGFAFDLEPQDENIRTYGMRLDRENAILFNDAAVACRVKLLLPEPAAALAQTVTVPVFTVPDALAETLAARIVVEKNYVNGAAAVTTAAAENLSGFTTITVSIKPTSTVILLR